MLYLSRHVKQNLVDAAKNVIAIVYHPRRLIICGYIPPPTYIIVNNYSKQLCYSVAWNLVVHMDL